MSDVATVNLIELFKYNKQELGVLLALLTHSGKVPQILAELEAEGGSLGQQSSKVTPKPMPNCKQWQQPNWRKASDEIST